VALIDEIAEPHASEQYDRACLDETVRTANRWQARPLRRDRRIEAE
jgi:hypothetical protein